MKTLMEIQGDSMSKERSWAIEDHLCRVCGGRILRCVKGNGMSPGGNPAYKCADCGIETTSLGPQELCWCGMKHRNQNESAYICISFEKIKEYPEYLNAFRNCGCDPVRGEVGIMLRNDFNRIQIEARNKNESR